MRIIFALKYRSLYLWLTKNLFLWKGIYMMVYVGWHTSHGKNWRELKHIIRKLWLRGKVIWRAIARLSLMCKSLNFKWNNVLQIVSSEINTKIFQMHAFQYLAKYYYIGTNNIRLSVCDTQFSRKWLNLLQVISWKYIVCENL